MTLKPETTTLCYTLLSSSSNCAQIDNTVREREKGKRKESVTVRAMAIQAAPATRLKATITSAISPSSFTTGHDGFRRSSDRLALKSSFLSPSLHLLNASPRQPPKPKASLKISMRTASKQAYICRDCGYIYNDRTPFEKQPDKYFCPVCGAPKRRFRAYEPPVTKNANDKDIRKARKAELQRDEAIGRALPIAIVVGVAALAGLYFYLNSAF